MRKSCLLFCIVFAKKVFLENWRINYAKNLFFVFVFIKISDYVKLVREKLRKSTEIKSARDRASRGAAVCVRARRRVERASERAREKKNPAGRRGGAGRRGQ